MKPGIPLRNPEYFQVIAKRYDFINHLISFGRDIRWRRLVLNYLRKGEGVRVLDACTGTGDMAFELAKLPWVSGITGVDISGQMLAAAGEKAISRGAASKTHFIPGDVSCLSFKNGTFDMATICFGLRNTPDRGKSIAELLRVLKPGGELYILEFAPSRYSRIAPLYFIYLKLLVPFLGSLVSGSMAAYKYLSDSIQAFPGPRETVNLIRNAGGSGVRAIPFTFGVVYLYICRKSKGN